MRPNRSFKKFCRRQPGLFDEWIYVRTKQTEGQEFGDVTSLVNALRNRRIYQFSSLRLLTDLVDVMRGSQPRGGGAARRLPAAPAAAAALTSDRLLIERAAESSPCLFSSLDLGSPAQSQKPRTLAIHRIVLCQRERLDAPVAALAQLLAAAIARQFDEPAAAVVFDGRMARAHLWVGKHQVRVAKPSASYSALIQTLTALSIPARRSNPLRRPILHLVVAVPGPARSIPATFRTPPALWLARAAGAGATSALTRAHTAGYDRIVYLTDAVPTQAPAQWVTLLAKAVRWRVPAQPDSEGPYFCSFIPTLIRVPQRRGRAFDSRPVDQELDSTPAQRSQDRGWRLRRDQCLAPFFELPIHGDAGPGQLPSAAALLADPGAREIAGRWARAVTNRRVGLALSGGGALSYRLIPIIKGIRAQNVPIDIVSGVSGGALVAAYYCMHGVDGLDRCLALGKRIGLCRLATAFFVSGTFESLVDGDLGDIDVTSLETRFVALSTAMLDEEPPKAHIVTQGSLGAAVQVSGAAPLLFGPTVKQTSRGEVRFADGATSAFIPARILKDCGADVVFAFNCLAGPRDSNPLTESTAGRYLYKLPFVDRLIDLWISGSFLAQRIGRETDEDAHVYFEPDAEEWPLIRSFLFTAGKEIAADPTLRPKVRQCVDDCVDTWNQFK